MLNFIRTIATCTGAEAASALILFAGVFVMLGMG